MNVGDDAWGEPVELGWVDVDEFWDWSHEADVETVIGYVTFAKSVELRLGLRWV